MNDLTDLTNNIKALDFAINQLGAHKRNGDEILFLCPSPQCQGKTRKTLYYNSIKNTYLCQRCGDSGNAFTLGFRTAGEKSILTPTEKAINEYNNQHPNKRHRITPERMSKYHIKLAEFSPTTNIKKLCILDENEKVIKVLRSSKDTDKFLWMSTRNDFENVSSKQWIFTENLTDDTIYIVGGEWDAMEFTDQTGLQAVSPKTGEGFTLPNTEKLQETKTGLQFTKNKNIVIIFDNDETGKKGAANLAKFIKFHFAPTSIKVVDLSQVMAESGADVEDFFRKYNGTSDQLFELIDDTNQFAIEKSEIVESESNQINIITKQQEFAKSLPVPFVENLAEYLGGSAQDYTPDIVRRLFSVINRPQHVRAAAAGAIANELDLKDKEWRIAIKHYMATMTNTLPWIYIKEVLITNIIEKNIVAEKKSSMIQTTFHFYYYDIDRGLYEHITDQLKAQMIEDLIKDIVAPDSITRNSTFRKSVEIELDARLPLRPVIDFQKYEAKSIVNFKNGLYDIKQRKLIEHTKDHYTRYQVNADYTDSKEPPESFIESLNTWFGNEETIKEALKILYYMIADMERSEQIAIILRGQGGDGKGEFAKLCRSIIPADRTSAVRLEELQSSNAHVTANLYGKMLNIADETRKDIMIDDGIFKAVTGGSYLEANFKHKQPFIFKSKALFLILSNHELNTTDTTRGMFRRLKGLVFQKIPAEKKQLNYFDNELLPEIDLIVKYILDYGGDLYDAYGFVETESDRSIIKETAENNPIYSYWLELLEELPDSKSLLFTKDDFVSMSAHYEVYKTYCDTNGYRKPNIKTFSKNTINVLDRISDNFGFTIEEKRRRVPDALPGKTKQSRGFDLFFVAQQPKSVPRQRGTKDENTELKDVNESEIPF